MQKIKSRIRQKLQIDLILVCAGMVLFGCAKKTVVDDPARSRALAERICNALEIAKTNSDVARKLPETAELITMNNFVADPRAKTFRFASVWRYDEDKGALVGGGFKIGPEETWYEISVRNLPVISKDDIHKMRSVLR